MFSKYEADLLCQNMSHITTKAEGSGYPSPYIARTLSNWYLMTNDVINASVLPRDVT